MIFKGVKNDMFFDLSRELFVSPRATARPRDEEHNLCQGAAREVSFSGAAAKSDAVALPRNRRGAVLVESAHRERTPSKPDARWGYENVKGAQHAHADVAVDLLRLRIVHKDWNMLENLTAEAHRSRDELGTDLFAVDARLSQHTGVADVPFA